MREMKDSGIKWIGNIPADWTIGKVKTAFIRKKTEAHQDDPVVLSLSRSGVKVRDISSGEGQIAESYYNYNPVEEGDFLINPMDLYSGANCSVSRVRGVISPAYINLRAKKNYCAEYYDYYFKTQYWSMAMFAHGKGVSFDNRWTLSANDLLNYFMPIPSFEEQNKIASFLNNQCIHIDSVIEKTKSSIEVYKNLKLAIITQAITKGIRKGRINKQTNILWFEDIPDEWEVLKISRVGKTSSGATPLRTNEAAFFDDATIRWIRTLDLNDWLVNDSSEKITELALNNSSCSIMPIGTVCVAMYGGAGTIGKCGLLTQECATNQAVCSIVCDTRRILPMFLLFQLIAIRKYWMLYAVGTRKDPNISQDIVGKMKILVPPVSEQNEIIEYLTEKNTEIENLIRKKEQLIDELEKYKKSLIYECVTGKLEVN